jgi:hypothetical protein
MYVRTYLTRVFGGRGEVVSGLIRKHSKSQYDLAHCYSHVSHYIVLPAATLQLLFTLRIFKNVNKAGVFRYGKGIPFSRKQLLSE